MGAAGFFLAAVIGFAYVKGEFLTGEFVLHERRAVAPAGFTSSGAAPGDAVLNLRINIAQNDLPGLEAAINAVSSPSNPWYGQWLAKEEVESFSRPSETTVAAIMKWLADNGLNHTSLAVDWIAINVSVAQANRMFDADFSVFTHSESGKQYVRTLQYSIPASLDGHVRLITPATSFPQLGRSRPQISVSSAVVPESTISSDGTPAASCSAAMTPSCLQTLYNIRTTAATSKTNRIGVVSFIDQWANNADLANFLKIFRPDISSATTFTLTTVDGGTNSQTLNEAGVEADLDIQYTVGLATSVPVNFISVGENNLDGVEGFLDVMNNLIAQAAPPQVVTTSFGFDEVDLSRAAATALCNAYMQLTARGVSILFAAGDGGVSGSQSQSCTKFIPTFPSGCPFVTVVGATQGVPETAASFSAGGFSNYFAPQSWQTAAVRGYISALGTQFSGLYNTTGRGYPDVAAMGNNIEIVVAGQKGAVAGTSASSPIFASVIGLLNDELVSNGKPVLGFLNPWLYANPGAFNDITSGSNPGCGTAGFSAKAGWDPVTGLGTPNYALMRIAAGVDEPGCTC
ncbi:family S53 protease [Mycena epipterygia]|nr:family S53 protease [Mycena epipterygia]